MLQKLRKVALRIKDCNKIIFSRTNVDKACRLHHPIINRTAKQKKLCTNELCAKKLYINKLASSKDWHRLANISNFLMFRLSDVREKY